MSTDNTSKSQATILFQSVLEAIVSNDVLRIRENLDQLPISIIPNSQAEIFLAYFLNLAVGNTNTDAVREIITHFDVSRARVDPLPTITNIFLNTNLGHDVLTFTISCFPEKIPIDFFVDLVNMGDDVSALKAATMISAFFPDIPTEDWNILVGLTDDFEEEEYENKLLRAFFQRKASGTKTYAKRPDWVRDDIPQTKIDNITIQLPTVKEAVDLLLADLKSRKIGISPEDDQDDEEELKQMLISQYAISSVPEKIQMLSHIRKFPDFNDINIFREFGPVNTIYTLSTSPMDPEHECSKYAGCRMLSCKEFEGKASDGEEPDLMMCDEHIYDHHWFPGFCERPKCPHKILHPHYALRLPLLHGGWKGCYCSFDCMKEYITDRLTAVMVGRMKTQLSVFGIRERK